MLHCSFASLIQAHCPSKSADEVASSSAARNTLSSSLVAPPMSKAAFHKIFFGMAPFAAWTWLAFFV